MSLFRLLPILALFSLGASAADLPAAPSIGGTDHPVVQIVEFADYQCPYCRKAQTEVIPKIVAEYGDKVQILFRNFPLPFHEHGQSAALAAICAGEQGKFKEMHDYLFLNQEKLGDALYREGAREFGMNESAFEICLSSVAARSVLDHDMAEANDLMVSGTPNFVLTTGSKIERINGTYPYGEFKAAIERLLHK
jgi:protein-disulfide isomerase